MTGLFLLSGTLVRDPKIAASDAALRHASR
jgi:hypothetical protein